MSCIAGRSTMSQNLKDQASYFAAADKSFKARMA
jgi:hypothetical protein